MRDAVRQRHFVNLLVASLEIVEVICLELKQPNWKMALSIKFDVCGCLLQTSSIPITTY